MFGDENQTNIAMQGAPTPHPSPACKQFPAHIQEGKQQHHSTTQYSVRRPLHSLSINLPNFSRQQPIKQPFAGDSAGKEEHQHEGAAASKPLEGCHAHNIIPSISFQDQQQFSIDHSSSVGSLLVSEPGDTAAVKKTESVNHSRTSAQIHQRTGHMSRSPSVSTLNSAGLHQFCPLGSMQDMHAAVQAAPRTSAGQHSTPSSQEAFHRLQHQQQQRWQQHLNRASAGKPVIVPFSQHPAVSLLLASTQASTHDPNLWAASHATGSKQRPSTQQPASTSQPAAATAAPKRSAEQAAGAQADLAHILQKLTVSQQEEGNSTARSLEHVLLANHSGSRHVHQADPLQGSAPSMLAPVHPAASIGAQYTISGGFVPSKTESLPCPELHHAQLLARGTQHNQASRAPCQHSFDTISTMSSHALAAPARYTSSTTGLVDRRPQTQIQQAELMFVRQHRSQRQAQQARHTSSTHQQHFTLFTLAQDPNKSLLQLAASRAEAAQQFRAVGAPAGSFCPASEVTFEIEHPPATHAHQPSTYPEVGCLRTCADSSRLSSQAVQVSCRPAVDVDGLPVSGPLTASLRAFRAAAGSSAGPSQSAQGELSAAAAATARIIPASMSDIELKREMGSSAAAIHGMATTVPQPQPHQGKALELLSSKAATLLSRQQGLRTASRLHAASYPSISTGDYHPTAHPSRTGSSQVQAAASTGQAPAASGVSVGAHVPESAFYMPKMTDTLQLQDSMASITYSIKSSSIGSTGDFSEAAAGPLKGSRLALWQRQPSAESATGRRQLSMSSELRATFTGALQRMTGAVKASVARPGSKMPQCSSSPVATFLSPLDPGSGRSYGAGDVYLTPEAADSSSDSAYSDSDGSSTPDSLADTAASGTSYALRAHMMGLSRNSPFVGLLPDADDYIL